MSISSAVKSDPQLLVASNLRVKWLAWLLLGFASIVLAEKAAELSDDFLEYLGELEDSDDSWSDFSQEAQSQSEQKPDASAGTSIGNAHHASSLSVEQSRYGGNDKSASGRSSK